MLSAILPFMPTHNILVVVVDGLRASALGAYGNTTFPTPSLDKFATQSLLFDWCYAASPDLADICRELWQSGTTALLPQIKSRGYATTLVTDDPTVTRFEAVADFDKCLQLNEDTAHRLPTARAKDATHTASARLFATAADAVASTSPGLPQLVWLHSRGLYGPWDAPLAMQESLLDESDPPPVEEVTPPDFQIAPADDPDAAFRYGCAYAAQAMILDECWETLIGAVDSARGADRWLVALVGARGFPLGEHLRVGGVDPRLYGEQLHVPWLIRNPYGANRLARSGQLTTHCDLARSIINADETSVQKLPWRDELVAASDAGHRAIRTADWCLRQSSDLQVNDLGSASGDATSTGVELFVRPDDRWEANDVAKLCPDVVESLRARLHESA